MAGQKTPLLSSVPFGACLTYSPRGQSEQSRISRDVTYAIKNVRPDRVAQAIDVLRKVLERGELTDFFGENVTLVPAPRSYPLEPGWLWPGERLCREIVAAGLAMDVLTCLRRTEKVAKSASARPGERTTPEQHRDTIAMDLPPLIRPAAVTIVDDVLTKGATLLACASHVQAALPETPVRVFGMVRTQGFADDIERVVEPCAGLITYDGANVYRTP